MPAKEKTGHSDKATLPRRSTKPTSPKLTSLVRKSSSEQTAIRKARLAPHLLSRRDVLQLQRVMGNRAVGRILESRGQQQQTSASDQPTQQSDLDEKRSTGMPDGLKAGVENLSGMSMDDVQVHYNSSKPAELQALAYTQGTDIHVAPGQENCLAHEAWHVVQQKQERVRATTHSMSLPVNDDLALEKEADTLGAQAARQTFNTPDLLEHNESRSQNGQLGQEVCQRYSKFTWKSKKPARRNSIRKAQVHVL